MIEFTYIKDLLCKSHRILEMEVDIKGHVIQSLHFTHEETEDKQEEKDDPKIIKLDDSPRIINNP